MHRGAGEGVVAFASSCIAVPFSYLSAYAQLCQLAYILYEVGHSWKFVSKPERVSHKGVKGLQTFSREKFHKGTYLNLLEMLRRQIQFFLFITDHLRVPLVT